MPLPARSACLLPLLLALPLAAHAQPIELAPAPDAPAPADLTYALGLAVIDAPTYAGASGRAQKLRPLWALRHGRFKLSGSRSSGLLGGPGAEKHSGASADLVDNDRWSLNVGLRLDNGRSPGDDPVLAGLPAIRSTLRGRLAAHWRLGGGFSTSLSYAADLLGRDGGSQVGWGLGYGWAPWPTARASLGVGATWADRRHMQTHYGITPAVAQRSGRAAFQPDAGLLDLNAGLVLQVPLEGRWTVTGGLTLSQLTGDAAASPLTRRAFGGTASVALGWRSH